MELAKITSDLQIEFPAAVEEWLRAESGLIVFLAGDTLMLKKINVPKPYTIAGRKAGPEMPMDEIVDEVRKYREEKRSRPSR